MVSIDRSPPDDTTSPANYETSTMGDPRAEGRGLVNGSLYATGFWVVVGVGFIIWIMVR